MDDILATVLILVAGLIGAALGFALCFFMKLGGERVEPDANIAQMAIQIAEIKTKFEEIEKGRQALEVERQKNAEEREKRWTEFVVGVQKNVEGVQKNVTGLITDVGQFQRLMLGTKQRGDVGEAMLKEFLKEPIKTGFVKTGVNTGNGVVEFAVDLGGGKYLPIDSKLPDVYRLLGEMEKTPEADKQKAIKRQIKLKLEGSIGEVVKYLNQPKTVDKCVLAVPDALIDMYPEMVGIARESNVYLTGYSYTYLVSYLLYEEHQRLRAEGDLGKYKMAVEALHSILANIIEKADTVSRGLKMAGKAIDDICDEARKGKHAG